MRDGEEGKKAVSGPGRWGDMHAIPPPEAFTAQSAFPITPTPMGGLSAAAKAEASCCLWLAQPQSIRQHASFLRSSASSLFCGGDSTPDSLSRFPYSFSWLSLIGSLDRHRPGLPHEASTSLCPLQRGEGLSGQGHGIGAFLSRAELWL
jgi:hypothetical protein